MSIQSIRNRTFKCTTEFEYHCFQYCYYIILEQMQSLKFNLDFTFDYNFSVQNNNEYILTKKNFFPKSNISDKDFIKYENYTEIENVMKRIKELLSQNKAVVVATDIFEYDYQPFFHHSHFLHAIIVTNIDNQCCEIYDDYSFWNFKGNVDRSLFEKSTCLINLGDIYKTTFPKYCIAWIDLKQSKNDISELINLFLLRSVELWCKEDGVRSYIEFLIKQFKDASINNYLLKQIEEDMFDIICDMKLYGFYLSWIDDTNLYMNFSIIMDLFKEILEQSMLIRRIILKSIFKNELNCKVIINNLTSLFDKTNKLIKEFKFQTIN